MMKISMQQAQIKRWTIIVTIALFAIIGTNLQSALASKIAAVVNGAVITDFDISQRQRLSRLLSGGKSKLGKSATLNNLIDDKLKLFEARTRGMTASDRDVSSALRNMAANVKLSEKRMLGIFQKAGINVETVKAWLKVEISWRNLINARFQTQARVEEADIYKILSEASGSGKKDVEKTIEFDLTRVLFITRKKASRNEVAMRLKEAKRFQSTFSSCSTDIAKARRLRDVAIEHIGRKSTTEVPDLLAKRLRETPLNKLTPPIKTNDGYEMVAVCGRKDLGTQETLRKKIESDLKQKQSTALARKYLAELKSKAVIEKR